MDKVHGEALRENVSMAEMLRLLWGWTDKLTNSPMSCAKTSTLYPAPLPALRVRRSQILTRKGEHIPSPWS